MQALGATTAIWSVSRYVLSKSISIFCIMEIVQQVLNGAAQDYLADPEFQYQVGPIDHLDSISELGKLDDSG